MSDSGGSGGSDVGEESQRPKVAPAVEKKDQQAEKQVRDPLWDIVLDLVIVRRGRQACLCGNITVGDLFFILFLLLLGGENHFIYNFCLF